MAANQVLLEQAFQDAKKWKRDRIRLCGGGEVFTDPVTKFEKENLDVFLAYDQNRAPDLVSPEMEEQIRFVMQTVQQQATNAFIKSGADFTRDPEKWIQFFARYPLLFNFREREGKTFKKEKFALTADAELIEECLGLRRPKTSQSPSSGH